MDRFIHSLIGGHVCCFQILAVTNKAVTNKKQKEKKRKRKGFKLTVKLAGTIS